jgi:hypothetical protein
VSYYNKNLFKAECDHLVNNFNGVDTMADLVNKTYIKEMKDLMIEQHNNPDQLHTTPAGDEPLDFIFVEGQEVTVAKWQNNMLPPQMDGTVLVYNLCTDPSEEHDLSKDPALAAEIAHLYQTLRTDIEKLPPNFVADANFMKQGQNVTITRDDGSEWSVKLPLSDVTGGLPEKCADAQVPFIPDDFSIHELSRLYEAGDMYRTLPNVSEKLQEEIEGVFAAWWKKICPLVADKCPETRPKTASEARAVVFKDDLANLDLSKVNFKPNLDKLL